MKHLLFRLTMLLLLGLAFQPCVAQTNQQLAKESVAKMSEAEMRELLPRAKQEAERAARALKGSYGSGLEEGIRKGNDIGSYENNSALVKEIEKRLRIIDAKLEQEKPEQQELNPDNQRQKEFNDATQRNMEKSQSRYNEYNKIAAQNAEACREGSVALDRVKANNDTRDFKSISQADFAKNSRSQTSPQEVNIKGRFQKKSQPSHQFAINPDSIYHLATWGDDVVPYELNGTISQETSPSLPTPIVPETQETPETNSDELSYLKRVVDKAIGAVFPFHAVKTTYEDIQTTKELLVKESEFFDKKFNQTLSSASDEELEVMVQEWDDIEKFAYLSDDTYKRGYSVLPQGYIRMSEAKKENLSPMDKDLQSAIKELNDNFSGFSCELYKTTEGNYVISYRGTEGFGITDVDLLKEKRVKAVVAAKQDVDTDVRGLITKMDPQSSKAISAAKEVKKIIDKYQFPKLKNKPTLTCTGHSLGGRLAQEAALATGLKAIVYNSADISRQTKMEVQNNKKSMSNIQSIASATDPLTMAQRTNTGKELVGDKVIQNEYILSPKVSKGSHSISNLALEVADRKLAILQELYRRKTQK